MAIRVDRAIELSKPVKHPDGYLTADVVLGRIGILEYRQPDGKVRRELVPPETLFDPDSMQTFVGVPVTNEHPDELLTTDTAKAHQVGMVHGAPEQGDGVLVGRVTITDADAISDIEKRRRVQVSPGYTCELDEEPGVWNGFPYDAVQKRRSYNHLAIVARGRAGSNVAIKLDGLQEVQGMNVTWKGIEFEVEETVAKELKTRFDEADAASASGEARVAELTAANADLQKKLDDVSAQLEAAKASRSDRMDSNEIERIIASRMILVEKAKAVTPTAKFDGLDEVGIMKSSLVEKNPGLKDRMDSMSADYVRARFDVMCEMDEQEKVARQAAVTSSAATAPSSDDSMSVRKRMIEKQMAKK